MKFEYQISNGKLYNQGLFGIGLDHILSNTSNIGVIFKFACFY